MLTRWDEWFSADNLARDERILNAPASISAGMAAQTFLSHGKHHILDLACGVGRDTSHLKSYGLEVTGSDASLNGLRAARRVKMDQAASTPFVAADARRLPFADGSFDGIYCFGLLHEFTGDATEQDVGCLIAESQRVLVQGGLLVLTAAAGDPQAGLPQIQLFNREMFLRTMDGWKLMEIKSFDDTGCTNRTDYHIWYGLFEK